MIETLESKNFNSQMDGTVHSDVNLFDEILEKTADFPRQNAIIFEEHD